MKFERKTLALGVAAACVWMGGNAYAADNHTITVAAAVSGTCKFNSAASTINLTVDPTAVTTLSPTGTVLYKCTKTTTPAFTLTSTSTSSTTGGDLISGTENFAYTFSSTGGGNGTGMGSGQDKTLTVTVNVDQALAANVTPGTYSDTITVNVTP
jgi:spore coat protein U domain-containing protein, fimbrial subunit CupE1/2/3/6